MTEKKAGAELQITITAVGVEGKALSRTTNESYGFGNVDDLNVVTDALIENLRLFFKGLSEQKAARGLAENQAETRSNRPSR